MLASEMSLTLSPERAMGIVLDAIQEIIPFELADGGTLFLDELGDLPLETQPKLLRSIQQGTFERLGGEKTLQADVRIISATNVRLEEKVRHGKFREDLYYRLNVFPVAVPPLRERQSDVVLLAHHFVEKMRARFGYDRVMLSDLAIRKLLENNWPGNVRELQNAIERALINCRGGQIEAEHIFFESQARPTRPEQLVLSASEAGFSDFETEMGRIITRALRQCSGRIYGKDGAAALLNLKPTTLQSKIKKLGLDKKPG
ncbi:MAG TPA: sigma 54-interacting transcriptional regulator [Candidatus Rifleibacterium sp.]|nr:sigma 54-interacting transcriptional regulator [Candidatus Rifleibacterium sp.]